MADSSDSSDVEVSCDDYFDDGSPVIQPLHDLEPMDVDPVISVAEDPDIMEMPIIPEKDLVRDTYKWKLTGWSRLDEKEWSERFHIAGRDWRIMLFPRGNYQQSSNSGSVSLYLQLSDVDKEEAGWGMTADFKLRLINQVDENKSQSKEAVHTFTTSASDWGFGSFRSVKDVESQGFLVDDTIILQAEIMVDMKQSSLYDSREETGFVGLRNQGATCYLNSWLQTLYNINIFRQAVYSIPTSEEAEPSSSIALALQAMFYQLQYGKRSVSTEDLTLSFGWDSSGSLMQEDVHEFNKILCETLERKMKGTKACGLTDKIFAGHILKFIECLNVDFKSEKSDMFQDIILDVRGCADVYASFDRITAEDKFDGENQYECEGHGKQDAKFGDRFANFPPVLQLHLKRFEYDFDRDVRVKINDRYEFPEMLDLDIADRKYQASNADGSKRNLFKLHSVLVHSGSTHGGHYYAFSRPDGCQWLRFDDEKVTKVESQVAIEQQFGADPHSTADGNSILTAAPLDMPRQTTHYFGIRASKYSSAYMLLYVREDDWNNIMCPVTDSDIPPHLARRIQAEEERLAKESRERDEEDQFRVVKVASVTDMKKHVGHDTFWDLVDWEKIRSWKQPRKTLLGDFKQLLAADLGFDSSKGHRLWFCVKRPNNTVRPLSLVPPADDSVRIGDLGESAVHRRDPLLLFLEEPTEVEFKMDMSTHRLIFLKYYDARSCKLSFLQCMPLPKATPLKRIADFVAHEVGTQGREIELVEEIQDHRDPKRAWDVLPMGNKLVVTAPQHGDIIVAQEVLREGESPYCSVQEYLSYIAVRRLVCLKSLTKPKSEGIIIEILGDSRYQGIARTVSAKLGCDWRRLRLTPHSLWSHGPRADHIKWQTEQTLDRIMGNLTGSKSGAVLYYEELEVPLEDLEKMRTLTVSVHDLQTKETGTRTLQVRRELLVKDVVALLQADQPLDALPLSLMQVIDSEVNKVLDDDMSVEELKVDHLWQLMAMPVGDIPQGGRLLHVMHIAPSPEAQPQVRAFGVPFVMGVSATETAAELLLRVQQRLGIADAEFASWVLYVVPPLSKPLAIADEEVVLDRFGRQQSTDGFSPRATTSEFLGLSHATKGPKRVKRPAVRDADRPLKIG